VKEITRIHIAKISYDIEIGAKKELETYIKDLEAYADDQELLQDIEIRITELLETRGVKQNNVITSDDIAAVRAQLGEPKEFMGDGDVAVGAEVKLNGEATRKLYRNTDSAVLGGVLSGIASFFRINPLWTRLVFIILLFASAGAALLVYIVLWIALPPARTAAEKLQMAGRPVTLGSIRELNEDQSGLERQRTEKVRRVILTVVGVVSLLTAIGIVIALLFAAIGSAAFISDPMAGHRPAISEWPYLTAFILLVLAGLLLAVLFSIGAYAAFKRILTKRLVIGAIVVIVAGLLSAGTAVGLAAYQSWQHSEQIRRDTKESTASLPADFKAVTELMVENTNGASIEYIVDSTPRMVVTALPDVKPVMIIDGSKARLSVTQPGDVKYLFSRPTITVYGPSLTTINTAGGSVRYQGAGQTELTAQADGGELVINGTVKTFTATSTKSASITADGATVEHAIVTTRDGGFVTLGYIKALSLAQPEACPGYGGDVGQNKVTVRGITSKTIEYNDQMFEAISKETNCGSVTIGDDLFEDNSYRS
jgi:phage shock protein PspC (stress-responsive transcriptional regulator)